MQTVMAGLLQFPRGIICKNEVLGRTYKTTIGGVVVGVQMPVIANKDNKNDVLKSSTPGFEFNIDWGYGIRVPDKTSLIKSTTIISDGEEECAVSIYKSFPDWLNRFRTIIRMYPYDLYKEPICQAMQRGKEGVDKYSGITLYRLLNNKWDYVRNPDNTIVAVLDPNYDNEGFSSEELSDAILGAGKETMFSQSHYFLSEACGAYQRGDNRSCVIFASLALEYSIVARVKKYCKENGIRFSPLGPLGNKFVKIKKYGIDIPMDNYQKRIVDFRNDVAHKGINVSDKEAIQFWKDCSFLIHYYDNNLFTNEFD